MPAVFSNSNLDGIVQNIGFFGPIVKEASDLNKRESFNVSGEYVGNWFRLHLSSVAIAIFIVVLVLFSFYLLLRFLKRRSEQEQQLAKNTGQIIGSTSEVKAISWTNFLLGLLSAVLIFGTAFFVGSIHDMLLIDTTEELVIILRIMTVLLNVLVVFGPAIIAASNYGWKSFVVVLVAEFLWLVILLVIYGLLSELVSVAYIGSDEVPPLPGPGIW